MQDNHVTSVIGAGQLHQSSRAHVGYTINIHKHMSMRIYAHSYIHTYLRTYIAIYVHVHS